MAATVSAIKWQSTGSEMAVEGLVTLSGTYATGGVPLTQLALGLSTVNSATFDQGAYTFKYDIANEKLLMYRSAGFTPAGTNSAPTITTGTNATTTAPVYTNGGALTQVAGATGITGVQAPTFTGTAVSAAALVEVANATSLTGITTTYRAVGY